MTADISLRMRTTNPMTKATADFLQPDPLSDLCLKVEGQKLYVHRQYLAQWSPVFHSMLTGPYSERAKPEIELPGKKASEIIQLLQCIYPSQRPVNERNFQFLLELADEYQIELVKNNCEQFLLGSTIPPLEVLLLAQRYAMPRLQRLAIEKSKRLTLEELEASPAFEYMSASTLADIYKIKLDMMRQHAVDLEERLATAEKQQSATERENDRLRQSQQAIARLWERNKSTKRCFRHMTAEFFDYGCTDCNEKVQREVRRLCCDSNRVW